MAETKCERCDYYPVHLPGSYYATLKLCLAAMLGYDCRRFIAPKHRVRR